MDISEMLESALKTAAKSTKKSIRNVDEHTPKLGNLLIEYAEKFDIEPVELYMIMKRLTKTFEQADPNLKKSGEIAKSLDGDAKKIIEGLINAIKD